MRRFGIAITIGLAAWCQACAPSEDAVTPASPTFALERLDGTSESWTPGEDTEATSPGSLAASIDASSAIWSEGESTEVAIPLRVAFCGSTTNWRQGIRQPTNGQAIQHV